MPYLPHTLPDSAHMQLKRLPQNRPLWLTCTLPWGPPEAELDFIRLLAAAPESPRAYWESSSHPLSLVGWGKAAEITDWGERRFHDIQGQAQRLAAQMMPVNPEAPMDAGPHWIGSFSFQPATIDDTLWQGFPDAYFLLPRVQFTRLKSQTGLSQTWLTMNLLVEDASDPQAIAATFEGYLAEVQALLLSEVHLPTPGEVDIEDMLSLADWEGMVTGALERIKTGELKKVVLARTIRASFESPRNPAELLRGLAERYPDCYRFMLEPQAGQFFLGASPELLAEVRAPFFRSSALAGTNRRGSSPAEDERLGQELLDSPKERQEHAIVITTIQENLAGLAAEIQIADQPELRKLGNVQHLETAIRGRLAPGWGVLDVAAALHPTPALGGWPKQAAQAYLNQAEPVGRGWYAAPVGWFDPWGNGLFAVGIRSGLFSERAATLYAGAGIVAGSDPAREWRETELKFMPLLDAIGAAAPELGLSDVR